MISVSAIQRRQISLAAVALLLAVGLMAMPPITIGGLSIWLYLLPALVAGYCLPYRSFVVLVVGGIVLGRVVSNQHPPAFMAEATASAFLLVALTSWRKATSRVDTVLLAATLITFLAYPWMVWANYYFSGTNFQQAVFMATRYSVSSLISVLLAELFIITTTLSSQHGLQWLRDTLNFRPSFVHVVELIIGASITVSLVLMLTVFWSVWDRDVKKSVVEMTTMRMQSLFSTAELAVIREMRRIDSALTLGSSLLEDTQMTQLLDDLARELTIDPTSDKFANRFKLELGAYTRKGQIFASSGLSATRIQKLLQRAKDQERDGLVKLLDRDEQGREQMVYVLLGDSPSDLVLLFPTIESAHDFTYSEALTRYSAVYGEPIRRVGVIDANGISDDALPRSAVLVNREQNGSLLWRPDTAENSATCMRAYSARIDSSVRLTAPPPIQVINRFDTKLHGVDQYAVTLRYWPFVESYIRIVIITSAASLALLVLLLWAARLMVGGLIRPLSDLTTIFETWRNLRHDDQSSGAALQALDSKGYSSLEDIHSLQFGFRSLAHDVIYGERRMSIIAANYDELLRSLPLGVLAVDGDLQVQFSNDAMGDITERQDEAIERIKVQSASMLAAGITVDEWQLNLSERPPKNLLLVVNHRLDDFGQEVGFWIIATDLTAQKQTNAQLIQASKLATLGEMSTGMAHELNQPLNVISLAANNLRFAINKGKATPENTLSKLERIDGAVHRAASIIDHMRSYGRLAGEKLTAIDVGEIVRGVDNLLAEQLKLASITLINKVPSNGLMIKGNAIQLEQVLINLINNGKDAIRETSEGGNIVVDSELRSDRILLRVTDSGGGIPDHVLPHIFEPFFTTKPVGKGTGLGGSISYGIVREMQGDIWAENVEGGAQISISLPLMTKTSLS